MIFDYAILRRAFLECEEINSKMGRILKGKRSPFIDIALDYHRAELNLIIALKKNFPEESGYQFRIL